jgi:hypothetical protein
MPLLAAGGGGGGENDVGLCSDVARIFCPTTIPIMHLQLSFNHSFICHSLPADKFIFIFLDHIPAPILKHKLRRDGNMHVRDELSR